VKIVRQFRALRSSSGKLRHVGRASRSNTFQLFTAWRRRWIGVMMPGFREEWTLPTLLRKDGEPHRSKWNTVPCKRPL
jgi:hypothetical protein